MKKVYSSASEALDEVFQDGMLMAADGLELCGIPGFYTKTGVGTVIAEGKEHKEFDSETYTMERGIVADLSIVKAWKADETGNLVFRKTARNFTMFGRICVAEVEEIVPLGSLDPDTIHLPGIDVHRLIQGTHEKRIEQRITRVA
ncbi:CoA transferase subunit A [uncultured Roseobacter sp.]|uniref:CoA transferase subunit A n=1 Tax=uncultured Roseobacter sp. TaxID=114847 RepID=UPI0026054D6C|nr:CoA-transferase [uncultured Roseobacter sp.]